ncbi:hypothetical protein SEEH4403_02737 [Salmonella enterica subsp. enterica serovar Heidelberg str. N4403]|nr:hypothetical protein SEEH4403_02737 [Salmonella enterica subsp. enterica serovar Heidelberg str. N4403]
MLLAMVVALVILPFLLTMAVNMAVQTAKRKARFRLLRRSINPGFSRYMNLPAVKLKACCLPFRALLARR